MTTPKPSRVRLICVFFALGLCALYAIIFVLFAQFDELRKRAAVSRIDSLQKRDSCPRVHNELRAICQNEECESIRISALRALERIHPKPQELADTYRDLLKRRTSNRERFYLALTIIRQNSEDKEAAQIIGEIIQTCSETEADAFCIRLSWLGANAQRFVPLFLEILTRTERSDRKAILVEALGNVGPEGAPKSLSKLRSLLMDDSREVKLQAIQALEQLGAAARPALQDLVQYVPERDIELYHAAVQAIGRIKSESK